MNRTLSEVFAIVTDIMPIIDLVSKDRADGHFTLAEIFELATKVITVMQKYKIESSELQQVLNAMQLLSPMINK